MPNMPARWRPRARRVLAVAAFALAAGAAIHLLAAYGAFGGAMDACVVERTQGKAHEAVRRRDKAAQATYYKLYYFTFGVASVRLALFLPGRGKHLVAFGMLAAAATHGLRLLLYFRAILPLGRLARRSSAEHQTDCNESAALHSYGLDAHCR